MNLSKYDILSYAKLSFKATFHCDKRSIKSFSTWEPVENSGIFAVNTGLMGYMAAKSKLASLLMLIKGHAHTEWDDMLEVGISFPENISKLYQANALKLVLSTNEETLYSNFPDRKNRVGSRSVSELIKPGINADSMRRMLCSDVYGIDLSHTGDNIIIYRYIGGKDYDKKFDVISAIIDKWILDTYSVITNPEYTQEEMSKLSKLSKTDTNIDDVFVSFKTFNDKYSNVNILIDLKPLEGQENVFWATIKERLAETIKATKISDKTEMTINYDTDTGRLQIKDSKLYAVSGLRDIDMIDCVISGDISNLSLYFCHILNASADFCDFFNGCDAIKSKLNNCYVSDGSALNDCVIDGDSTISGDLQGCVLTSKVKYTKSAHLKDCKNNATKI